MNEFEADLRNAIAYLEEARSNLIDVVQALKDDDLELSKRGGWSVRAILLHVIGGERHHTNGIRFLRGWGELPSAPSLSGLESVGDAVRSLQEGRSGLMATLDGLDEEAFYALRPLLNEEGHGQSYSVLSILENIALHDREHRAQIEATVALHSA